METPFIGIYGLYKVNTYLFNTGLKDVTDELARRQLGEKVNPILWIAGHLTSYRYTIMKTLGAEIPFPLGDGFKRGQPYTPTGSYSSVPEIKAAWDAVSEKLLPKLESLTAAELAKTGFDGLPHKDGTLQGALMFLVYHEGYHIGQISTIRTGLGLEGLIK